MLDQLLPSGVLVNHRAITGQEPGVLFDQGVLGEPRCHRGVLDGLHLHRVWRPVAFKLSDYQPAIGVKAEHVQSVSLATATKRLPAVKLERHYKNVLTQDLGVGEHPLLQV